MVATRSSTKWAEMTDQQSATSAATGEPSQQPVMLADMRALSMNCAESDERQKKIWAEQDEHRNQRRAEQDAQQTERNARQRAEWAEQNKRWAEEDAGKWAESTEQKTSLREEASQWRDATEVRPSVWSVCVWQRVVADSLAATDMENVVCVTWSAEVRGLPLRPIN